jgi:hypothetical protein
MRGRENLTACVYAKCLQWKQVICISIYLLYMKVINVSISNEWSAGKPQHYSTLDALQANRSTVTRSTLNTDNCRQDVKYTGHNSSNDRNTMNAVGLKTTM